MVSQMFLVARLTYSEQMDFFDHERLIEGAACSDTSISYLDGRISFE